MQGIPSSEALRQAALHASWARDRAKRRHKLSWRWTAWFGTRWVFPVVMAGALGWVPASLRLAAPLTPGELSQFDGLRFSPAIDVDASGAAASSAPTQIPEPPGGISLRSDTQLKTKEKQ